MGRRRRRRKKKSERIFANRTLLCCAPKRSLKMWISLCCKVYRSVPKRCFHQYAPAASPPPPPPPLRRLYSSSSAAKSVVSDAEVIYSGALSKKIFRLKLFSFGCSVATLAFQWKVWNKTDMNRVVLIFVSSALAFFTFCTPLLIHFIAKKYCVQMLYHARKDVYVAKTYSFFMTKKTITFTPADVKIPEINRLFTIAFVKGYPLFFDAEEFTDLEHYKRIMGYDKPIDFQLRKE